MINKWINIVQLKVLMIRILSEGTSFGNDFKNVVHY